MQVGPDDFPKKGETNATNMIPKLYRSEYIYNQGPKGEYKNNRREDLHKTYKIIRIFNTINFFIFSMYCIVH